MESYSSNYDEFDQVYDLTICEGTHHFNHPQTDVSAASAFASQAARKAPIAAQTVSSTAHATPFTNSMAPMPLLHLPHPIATPTKQGKPLREKRGVTVSDVQKLKSEVLELEKEKLKLEIKNGSLKWKLRKWRQNSLKNIESIY